MTAHLAAAFTSPRNRNRLLPISTLLQVPKSGKPDFGRGEVGALLRAG
jgi:hypothetical protein